MNDQSDLYFVDGGTLDPNNPSYVPRPADRELLQKILEGSFCHVLTARQMGKSSLMIRTAQSLRERNVQTAIIDLTKIGSNVIANQWYLGLLSEIKRELDLKVDMLEFWSDFEYLSTQQRFINFLHDVILKEISGNVAIFVDEIDTTLDLPFRDDFFAAVRAIYNARASDPLYSRLTFILLGVIAPTDLNKDLNRTPFNIGTHILLQELSYHDAKPLLEGLERSYRGQGERILKHIFSWTNGHPYLTQFLCLKAVELHEQHWDETKIDALVAKHFFSDEGRHDRNLNFVRDRIRAVAPNERQAMLKLYQAIYTGRTISEEEQSRPQIQLKLLGLVRAEQIHLRVSNEIYRRVFNETWITENLSGSPTGRLKPPRRIHWSYIAIIALVLVAAVAIVAITFISL
jgi:hypothetical protein